MLAFVAAGGGVAVKPSSVQALQLEGAAYYREIENVPVVELTVAWMRGNLSAVLPIFLDVVVTATAGPSASVAVSGPAPFPSDERLPLS